MEAEEGGVCVGNLHSVSKCGTARNRFLSYKHKLGTWTDPGPPVASSIEGMAEVFVVGKPDMTVVAFGAHSLNIYQINDAMTQRGWSLNALQRPARWGWGH